MQVFARWPMLDEVISTDYRQFDVIWADEGGATVI